MRVFSERRRARRAGVLAIALGLSAGCSGGVERPTAPAPSAALPAPATNPVTAAEAAVPIGPAAALVFDLPIPSLDGLRPLTLWATWYYVPRVRHVADGFALRDMAGVDLGPRLSRVDWCEAAMEGTVLISSPGADEVLINYAGVQADVQVDCTPIYPKHPAIGRSRYAPARGPWGDGVQDMILVPYRSVAVDPATIPFGSTLYVPAARGVQLQLPDGERATHDGWFYAADRGGAIKGNHVDVFSGIGRNNPFPFVASKSTVTFEAWIVDDGTAADRLRPAHRAPR